MPVVLCSAHQWYDEPIGGTRPGFIHQLCRLCGGSQEVLCSHQFRPLGQIGSANPIAHECARCGLVQ